MLSWQVRQAQARRPPPATDEVVVSLSDDEGASLTLPEVSTASNPLEGDALPDGSIEVEGAKRGVGDGFFDQDAEPDAADPPEAGVDAGTDALFDQDGDPAPTDVGPAGDGDDGLGDELDAELEAEAAAMAPLVELPDRVAFGEDGERAEATLAGGPDVVTVRVRGRGQLPAHKVRRVVRRVDPLSVLKLSFLFNLCLFAMVLIAALLLWSAAVGSGSTDNVESFVVNLGFDGFRLVGADLFRGFVVFGGALVLIGTVFAVLVALLFNLISDIVGGIRFTVIEPFEANSESADEH